MRALDQPGNVRHRCPPKIVQFHDANHWMQSGERVSRNLWMGCRNCAAKRRLTRIWIPNQTGVCDCSQLQQENSFFALFTLEYSRGARLRELLKCTLPFPPLPRHNTKSVARQSKVGEWLASNRVHGIAGRINCAVIRFVRQNILKAMPVQPDPKPPCRPEL